MFSPFHTVLEIKWIGRMVDISHSQESVSFSSGGLEDNGTNVRSHSQI